MPRVHQMRTDLAQYYHRTKPSTRLTYITSADEKVNFEINGTDMLMRDLNIFASTTANHRAVLEQLKQMAMQNNTTGASIYDLGKVVQSDSIAELNAAMKGAEEKQQKQQQEQMQQQQQMQEQQLQQQQEMQKMKIDAEEMSKEKDRRKDILIAEIKASGFGAMKDINQNQQSDFKDEMDNIRKTEQYQQQTQIQREKQSNDMMKHNQKMSIEEQKIQAQRDIADKQLQIAKENKNKYDVKKSESKKKK